MNKIYKENLPQPIPARILALPTQNGFPVPWFVAQVEGVYDFRIVDTAKFAPAIKHRKCWICGQKLGTHLAFTIGPMCVINRTISEPPSHRDCAEWSIKACPFLTQRQDERRETNLPDNIKEPGGIAIARQPGAICLWVTNKYEVIRLSNGLIFKIGEPLEVAWFREGRSATKVEVLDSINSGYPILLEMAKEEGNKSVKELEIKKAAALQLIPSA